MLKLVLALAALAALGGAFALAPIHGRTLLDRWNAARSPREFAERVWDEAKASVGGAASPHRRALGRGAPTGAPPRTARAARPAHAPRRAVEQPTEADRAELDRIVAEHALGR